MVHVTPLQIDEGSKEKSSGYVFVYRGFDLRNVEKICAKVDKIDSKGVAVETSFNPTGNKTPGHPLRGKLTILLDVGVELLKSALQGQGFKVLSRPKELSDDEFKKMAECWAILTLNPQGYVDDAVPFDYDVISIHPVEISKLVAADVGKKIAMTIRESGFALMRGNFHLKIFMKEGRFEIIALV